MASANTCPYCHGVHGFTEPCTFVDARTGGSRGRPRGTPISPRGGSPCCGGPGDRDFEIFVRAIRENNPHSRVQTGRIWEPDYDVRALTTTPVAADRLLSPPELRVLAEVFDGREEVPEGAEGLLGFLKASSPQFLKTGNLNLPISRPHVVELPRVSTGSLPGRGAFRPGCLPPDYTAQIFDRARDPRDASGGTIIIPTGGQGDKLLNYFSCVWDGVENRSRIFPITFPYTTVGRIEIWRNDAPKFPFQMYLGYNPGCATLVGTKSVGSHIHGPRSAVTAAHCLDWTIDGKFLVRFIAAHYDGQDALFWGQMFSTIGNFSIDHWTGSTTNQGGPADWALLTLAFPDSPKHGCLGYGYMSDDVVDAGFTVFEHVGYPWALINEVDPFWVYWNTLPPGTNGNNSKFNKRPSLQTGISFYDTVEDGGSWLLKSDNACITVGNSGGPFFAYFDQEYGFPEPGLYVLGVSSVMAVNSSTGEGLYTAAAGGPDFCNLVNAHLK
jgi:hypothetical protein